MRQLTVTIPDEYYDSLIEFLKTIPDVLLDNRQAEYDISIEKMVLERIKNAKPEDYLDWEDVKKEMDKKWLK
jgi:hypothetical protein